MSEIKNDTRLNWNPDFLKKLDSLLSAPLPKKSFAVFDWDHTCVFNDCQDAVFRYQLEKLEFKLTPKDLQLTFSAQREIIVYEAAFYELFQRIQRLRKSATTEQIVQNPMHDEFVKLGLHLNQLYLKDPRLGPKFAYAWIIKWLKGFTETEAFDLAQKSIKEALKLPLSEQGLRVQFAMLALIQQLRSSGIQPYVVTASHQSVVQAIACDPALGYGFQMNEIKGMRLDTDSKKRFTLDLKHAWPMTWRSGKVEAIRKEISSSLDPLLVAGDSDGDYEMLTQFKDMKIGLILEKPGQVDLGKLMTKIRAGEPGTERYVIQKRNLETGEFLQI